MTILGLDLATRIAGAVILNYDTGAIVLAREIRVGGTLATAKRCSTIANEISLIVGQHQPADVWIEDIGSRHTQTAIGMGRIHQAVHERLERHHLTYGYVSPREVKQFATGSGNADKAEMIAAAEARWPDVKFTADTADAAWVAEFGRQRMIAAVNEAGGAA